MYSSKNSGLEGNLWAMCAYEKRRKAKENVFNSQTAQRVCVVQNFTFARSRGRARSAQLRLRPRKS